MAATTGNAGPNADGGSARLAAVIVELRRVMRRQHQRAEQEDTRTLTEKEVLRYLGSNPGASTAAIAEGLRLRPNTISGLVSGLAKDGLLLRVRNPRDARGARFYLQPEAEAARLTRLGQRSDVLTGAMTGMDDADRAAIAAAVPALERLTDILARQTGPAASR